MVYYTLKEEIRMQEEYLQGRPIYKNVLTKGKLFTIDITRWVEAVIVSGSVGYGIYQIPFVTRVKWIVIIVVCVSLAVLFLHGIRNRSVFQLLLDVIKDSRYTAKYSLGSVNNERKGKQATYYKFGGESYLDRLIATIKHKFKAFDEKYGGEEDS